MLSSWSQVFRISGARGDRFQDFIAHSCRKVEFLWRADDEEKILNCFQFGVFYGMQFHLGSSQLGLSRRFCISFGIGVGIGILLDCFDDGKGALVEGRKVTTVCGGDIARSAGVVPTAT